MTVTSIVLGTVGQYVIPVVLPVVLPCLLLLLVRRLWYEYNISGRDPNFSAPLPDGDMGWPIIGETMSFALQGSSFYEKKFQRYGRLFKTHLFGSPTVRVRGAENIRKILHGENDIVTSYWPASTRTLMGAECLSQSQGAFHVRLRKHVSAAFSHSALSGYVSLVHPEITETIARWCRAPDGVAGYAECQLLTFKIAGKVLCGFDCESGEDTSKLINNFETIVKCLFTLPINIPGSGFNKGLKAYDVIKRRIEANVRRKMESDDTRDALRILMEQDTETGEAPSIGLIVSNAIDLLIAGYASTASAAYSILHYLHRNRHVLLKVRQELAAHKLDVSATPMTLEEINELKYVTTVAKELLRVSPPIGAAFRKAIRTFELDGKQIPAGWTVLYSIRETVGLSEIFKDREKFDPDRFSSARREDRASAGDRYHYCVFGGGSRSCIGKGFAMMMMRMLIIELARTCNWEVSDTDSLKMQQLPTPHPGNDLPVRFARLMDGGVDLNANSVVFESEKLLVNSNDSPREDGGSHQPIN